MPRLIGIVDDSVTIRAAFGMTFAGDDLDIETRAYASVDEAIQAGDKLELLYVDSHLGAQDGYAACARLRGSPVFSAIPLAVLYGPLDTYDEARGRAVGAVGGVAKPWETGDFIGKTRAFLSTPPPLPQTIGAALAAPRPPATPAATPPAPPPPRPATPAAPIVRPPAATPLRPAPLPVATAARPQSAPPAAPLAPSPPATPPRTAPLVPAPAGIDEARLADRIGARVPELSRDQALAVARVSREVIEEVAWEVVPDLAEAIIREQIQALLRP